MVLKVIRQWLKARRLREIEFKPAQFTTGYHLDGLRYYVEGGEEAPVTIVFVHGFTLAASAWHLQIAPLAEEARCIAMDLRGHGKSEQIPAEECSIDGAADDVMTVLDSAGLHGRVILVGHSLGGMVVLNLLRRYPQLRALCAGVVLVGTSARPFASEGVTQLLGLPVAESLRVAATTSPEQIDELRSRLTGLIAPAVRLSAYSSDPGPATGEFHVKLINDTPVSSLVGFLDDLQVHDESAVLPKLAGIPATVIVGAEDLFAPPAQSEYLVSQWPGATLQVVQEAGHMLPLESPMVVTAAVRSLLVGLD